MFGKSIITMIITMISRVLGLFRGTIVAYFFGSNYLTDAYYAAFKISNFFRQLLGEGALGNVFIPLYHKKVSDCGEESGKIYIFSIINLVGIFSIIISILMIIFSEYIISIMVVGFDAETKMIASKLLKIMSVYFIFISLAGMIGAVLNNFGEFVIPASTSIFFNLSIIIVSIFFTKRYGIEALAYGVVLGGFLQFIVVFIPLILKLKKYSFNINIKDSYVKLLGIQLIPMLVGVFARQINTLVDQFFASFLNEGGITALENATRIYLLPVGVFGVTLSNIIFPSISKFVAKRDYETSSRHIVLGINAINFFVIPSCFVLILYSKEIIKLIFSYGKFLEKDVIVTSEALLFYSIGLIFYTGIHLMSKSFYAYSDNKSPAKFSIISIIVNIILNTILIKPLAYKGLALSTSIAALVNFALLFYFFTKKYQKIDVNKILYMMIKYLISSVICYIISLGVNNIILKLLIFGSVYLLIWGLPLYKKRINLFY